MSSNLFAADNPINVAGIMAIMTGLVGVLITVVVLELLAGQRQRKTHHALDRLGYVLVCAAIFVIGTSMAFFTDLGNSIAGAVFNR